MTRMRSPNYPAFSLPSAVERVRLIHRAEGTNSAPREAIAKHMGFNSLNGASATALSALGKYGLIEEGSERGEAKVTDLAMRIMFPHDEEERRAAISEAAFRPALFAEIREKWPDRRPTPESLRPFLVRRGFTEGALDYVIQVYQDTIDMGDLLPAGHNPTPTPPAGEVAVPESIPSAIQQSSTPAPPTLGSRPFKLAFDGDVLTGSMALRTVRDIERLIKVLNAQKAAIEAMQDDDDPPEEYDPDLALDAYRERQDKQSQLS